MRLPVDFDDESSAAHFADDFERERVTSSLS